MSSMKSPRTSSFKASNKNEDENGPVKKKAKLGGTLDHYFKAKAQTNVILKESDGDENATRTTDLVTPSEVHVDSTLTLNSGDNDALSPEASMLVKEKALAAKLIKATKLFNILDPDMGKSWFSALEGEFRKDYFSKLDRFVSAERNRTKVYPEPHHVWEWTKHCAIHDIKVVILGQDPYHGPNQAHGLCFSVKKGVPPPPSLVNIFRELQSDIQDFVPPSHGCLEGWTNEGVLLLNAVLTVEAGKANSHKDKGWENITHAVISWISKNLNSVVFLLWGSHAQKMAANVDKRKHHLLTAVHPSPLSAHRGFLGCKHFSKANELLQKSGKAPINWSNLY